MRSHKSLTTLDDWLAWLPALAPAEINLGLERVTEVLARLDLPRPQRVLTVAGTNGKGSSVAMLEALFASLPGTVGAYTSPHILHYAERIRIDGRPIADARIVAAFERVAAVREDVALTYFEYGTLAALVAFAEARVDTALLEVGLGGRLDAVNAVDHDGCLITNISLDHTDWLGDSITAIAREKAGVMRAGLPAVYGSAVLPEAIADAATQTGAELKRAGRDFHWKIEGNADGHWHWQGQKHALRDLQALPLTGTHQLDNAAAVLALLEAVGIDELLQTERVNAAFASLSLPGRQQRIERHARRWLLDGAHNAAGAASLAATVADTPVEGRVLTVLGILQDKDAQAIVSALAEVSDDFIALRPPATRALPADDLGAIMAQAGQPPLRVISAPEAAFAAALDVSQPGDLIVVAGSFYTLESSLRWLAAGSEPSSSAATAATRLSESL